MHCFARWSKDDALGLCFRDQTILQFGSCWDLLASWVLLNPGSAVPAENEQQDVMLTSKSLPYFVAPFTGHYYRFTIDRLMADLLKLYAANHAGGVIKIYNLFNLKNQHSMRAIEQFKKYRSHCNMLTDAVDIHYGNAPVVIATGNGANGDPVLVATLQQFVEMATPDQLHAVTKIGEHRFAVTKTDVSDAIMASYHPSYTFKYGNEMMQLNFGGDR